MNFRSPTGMLLAAFLLFFLTGCYDRLTGNYDEIPELTAENYAAVLDAVLLQLNPETLRASAQAQVETTVRAQVEANADQVRSAVETAVQDKVLAAVLQSAGQNMTSEQYAQAVQAGLVSSEQAAAITAAVEQQMATEEVKAQIDAAVQQQIEQLIQDNAHHARNQEEYSEKFDALNNGIEEKKSEMTAVKQQISDTLARRENVRIFLEGLKGLDSIAEKFDIPSWHALVDHIRIMPDKSIIFCLRNGCEEIVRMAEVQ